MQWNEIFKKTLLVFGLTAFIAACAQREEPVEPEVTDEPEVTEPEEPIETGPVPGTQEHLTAMAGDRVFFDFDSSELDAMDRNTLRAQAEWLRTYPAVSVTIEGHADERGTREYNLALGERRASAVKNYLVALGIDADRINTISYGKERPVAFCSNESCWSQNRRGVMVVN